MPEISDEVSQLLDSAFFQWGIGRKKAFDKGTKEFVHYTSADAAISIIENNEIWLRNSVAMNDFSEIAHGEACVRYCLSDDQHTAQRSQEILDRIEDGLHSRLLNSFFEGTPQRRAFTYLVSISEHGPEEIEAGMVDVESSLGRLSMWRAYSPGVGVALVFKSAPFFEPSNALNAFTSPVFYGYSSEFAYLYNCMLSDIEKYTDALRQIDSDIVFNTLNNVLHFHSLSCKHPGFREEREWRVTYNANPAAECADDGEFNAESPVKREFRSINGMPQRIYKIPFVNHPNQGLNGVDFPSLFRRAIIGPTQYPIPVGDALQHALEGAGIEDARRRISISNIPLRE